MRFFFVIIFIFLSMISSTLSFIHDWEKEIYQPGGRKFESGEKVLERNSEGGGLVDELGEYLAEEFAGQEKLSNQHISPEKKKSVKLEIAKDNNYEGEKNQEENEADRKLERLLGFVKNHRDSIRRSREKNMKKIDANRDDNFKLKRTRRCRKKPEKHDGGEEIPQRFISEKKLVNEDKKISDDDKKIPKAGGEIVLTQKNNNTTNVMTNLGDFFKKSFNIGDDDTVNNPGEMKVTSENEDDELGEDERTTIAFPVEIILPASGVELADVSSHPSTTKTSTTTIRCNNKTPSNPANKIQGQVSPGSTIIGGRHASFDFEIKAIPLYRHTKPHCQ